MATVNRKTYVCGFCGKNVAPHQGFATDSQRGHPASIYICPFCERPTFFSSSGNQTPGVRWGRDVEGISDDGVRLLYNEARNCAAAGCHTAAVLVCRKILMHIGVVHGADPGLTFVAYVDFLKSKGFVPPNGDAWVDKIRTSGNEATHEIRMMSEAESRMIIGFVEMLLRFIFEFPSMVA